MSTFSLSGDPGRTRYSKVAMAMHWTIAVLLIANLLMGYWMGWLEDHAHDPSALNPHGFEAFLRSTTRPWLMGIHRPLGIFVLLLSVLRLAWRILTPQPPFAVHLQAWERALAHVVHWLFYVTMIGIPLLGWAMVSASKRYESFPVVLFGLPVPRLPLPRDHATHEMFQTWHTDWLPWMFWALLALHVLGALKHQFMDRDGELGRMVPWLREPGARSDTLH